MATADRTTELLKKLVEFREERDWAQFHDPKNLAEAVAIEAGELLQNFLWKTTEASHDLDPTELNSVQEEAADIYIFLLLMCEALGVDLMDAAENKLKTNALKYPVDKAKGNSRKYTQLNT